MEHKHYYYDVGGWEALASSTGNRSLVRSLELLELLLLLLLRLLFPLYSSPLNIRLAWHLEPKNPTKPYLLSIRNPH